MKHAPYPDYKPSGIEWLGDVPEHWPLNRLKWSMSGSVNGVWGDDPDGENDVVCVRVADFDRRNFQVDLSNPTLRSVAPSQRRDREIRRGDLLLEKSGGGEKQMVGCMVRYDHDVPAVCSNFVARVSTANGADSRFWTYMHAALYAGKLNYPAIKQTTGIQNLDSNAYFDTAVPYPPLAEQQLIAAFLDHETARVDSLIEKKHLLIDRLAEYRTALITRTVTKGLPPDVAEAEGFDPSPRLKPSGVEWLGDVPEHWVLAQLGRLGSFFKGGGGTKEDEVEEGLPCIRYGDLYTQHQFLIRHSRSDIAESQTHKYRELQYGDLLFAGSGETIEEIGKSAANVIEGPAYCGGDVIGFRPRVEIDANFLGYAADCSTAIYQKACMGRGVTVMHIYSSELKYLFIPLPPINEQQAIGVFLNRQMQRIDALCSRVEAAIERLHEFRSALVTAAVTGKIDVRDYEPAETGASA